MAARKLTAERINTDCKTELVELTTNGEKKPPTCDIKQAIECPVTRNSVGNNSGAATQATVLEHSESRSAEGNSYPAAIAPILAKKLKNRSIPFLVLVP
jgi:hypothetical protein